MAKGEMGWQQRLNAWRAQLAARRGRSGEKLAETFLRDAGMKIITRNWRSPRDRRDEIDLVCLDRGALVFVEVKTRSAQALVGGYHSIDLRKKRALRRAIDAYLHELPREDRPMTFRFDVVEVQAGIGGGATVRHFENVPLFDKFYLP